MDTKLVTYYVHGKKCQDS